MKKYLLSALFAVALLLPWASKAQCDQLREYPTPVRTSSTSSPAFTFTSISPNGVGTPWSLAEHQAGIAQFRMPFSMILGSQTISQGSTVYVSKNGFISFSPITNPAVMPDSKTIAPLAYLDNGGYIANAVNVYYTTSPDSVTVEWKDAGVDGLTANFQVILRKKDNEVMFAYGDMIFNVTRRYEVFQCVRVTATEYLYFKGNWAGVLTDTVNANPRVLDSVDINNVTNTAYSCKIPNRRPCSPVASNIKAKGARLSWSHVCTYNDDHQYVVYYTTDSAKIHNLVNRHRLSDYTTGSNAIPTTPETADNGDILKASATVVPDTNFYDVTGLAANTTYYFAVYTVTASNTSDYGYLSEVATFHTAMDTLNYVQWLRSTTTGTPTGIDDTIHACVQYQIEGYKIGTRTYAREILLDDGTYDPNYLISANESAVRQFRSHGKDSIIRYDVVIEQPTFIPTQAAMCDSAFWYIWYDATVANDTVMRDSLPPSSTTADKIIRFSDTARRYQLAYIVPVVYSSARPLDTLMKGCDIRMLDLVINRSATQVLRVDACSTYRWHIGNDSVFARVKPTTTAQFQTNPAFTGTYPTNADSNLNYGYNLADYHATPLANNLEDNFIDTVIHGRTAEGCDSIYTLDLHLYSNGTSTHYDTACNQYTWINGRTYKVNNTTDTVRVVNSDNGCYHTVTLNLKLYYESYNRLPAVERCDFYVWSVDTFFYDRTKAYSNTYPAPRLTRKGKHVDTIYYADHDTLRYYTSNIWGCDSIYVLPLNIKHTDSATLDTTVCDAFVWNGVDYQNNSSNWYQINGTRYVKYTKDTVIGYDQSKKAYNNNGSLRKTSRPGNEGCDSICGLILHVKHSSNDTIVDTACGTFTWNVVGEYHYKPTPTAKDRDSLFNYEIVSTVPSHNGSGYNNQTIFDSLVIYNAERCDSTVYLSLYLKSNGQKGTGYDTVIATSAGEYIYDNKHYPGPVITSTTPNGGTDSVHTPSTKVGESSNGCDSLHYILLKVGNPYYQTINKTACGEYTWTDGDGKTYAQLDANAPVNAIYRNLTDNDYVYRNTLPSVTVHDTANNIRITGSGSTATYKYVADTVYSLYINFRTAIFGNDSRSHLMTTRMVKFGDPTAPIDSLDITGYRTVRHDTVVDHAVRFGSTRYCDSIVHYDVNLVYNISETPVTLCMSDADSVINWVADGTRLSFHVPANPNTERDTMYFAQMLVRDSGTADEWGYALLIHQLRSVYTTEYVTACGRYTWVENDSTYTRPTTGTIPSYPLNPADYVYRVGSNGCDSVIVLNLTLNPLTTSTVRKCGDFYKWGTDTVWGDFSNGRRYIDTLLYSTIDSATGACLSAKELRITLTKMDTTVVRLCSGEYTWASDFTELDGTHKFGLGVTYYRSGNGQEIKYYTAGGAQSASDRVAINNKGVVQAPGTNFTVYKTNTNTCDSAFYLDLRIANYTSPTAIAAGANPNPPTYGSLDVNACDEYIWVVDVPTNHTLTSSEAQIIDTFERDTNGVAFMFHNPRTGCDSILTLNLNIGNSTMGIDNQRACDVYTWIDGSTYTESTNAPTYRIPRAEGCDSVVNLHLVVNYSQTQNVSDTICAGNGYTAYGFNYSASSLPSQGVYRDSRVAHGTASNGCDMITVLTLRINPVSSSVEEVKACQSYTWNGNTYISNGTYEVHGLNQYGCDSTASIILSLGQPTHSFEEYQACEQITYQGETYYNTTILVNNSVNEYGCVNTDTIRLIVNQPSHSEQWVTEYGSFYWFDGTTYTTSGTYTATLPNADVNGCDSIITLYLTIINTEGIDQTDADAQLSLYPNPTYGKVNISGADVQRVEVLDIVGRKVAEFVNTNVFDITNLAEGAYTLRITTSNATLIRKVVKK